MKVKIKEFQEDELRLDPPIQIGDLIHKCFYLYTLIPRYDRLILLHLKGHWFGAIAFFDGHEAYVFFFNNFSPQIY